VEGEGYVTGNKRLEFSEDPDHDVEAGIFKGIYTIAAQWQLYEFLPTARAVVEDFL